MSDREIKYFTKTRNIPLSDTALERLEKVYRVNEYKDQRSLVAPMAERPDGAIKALHQILLDDSTPPGKTGGKFIGSQTGYAVWLGVPGRQLAIGEGAETCLSFASATDIPIAIAGTASNLGNLTIPTDVKRILILVDQDLNYKGQEAAQAAAKAYTEQGFQVQLVTPSDSCFASPGEKLDFNDLDTEKIKERLKQAAILEVVKRPVDAAISCELPELLPVPVEAFPTEIQSIIRDVTQAFGTLPEVVAIAILAIAGSLIGWSRRLIPKGGWHVHASLYVAIAAETGEGKSPATSFLLDPVEKLEHSEFIKHRKAEKEFEKQLEEWQDADKSTRGPKPQPPPERCRFKFGDTTIETLADGLAANPKGILWYRDELNGLLLDLDKYNGRAGSTKARLIEAYDLRPWQVDRVNKTRTAYIQKACLGILGTIQPAILLRAFDSLDAASGFLPRFIIVHAAKNSPTLWNDMEIGKGIADKWQDFVSRLAEYKIIRDQESQECKSRFVSLSPEAKDLYTKWYNHIALAPWNNFDQGIYRAIVPKIQEQALRICLILHCLESVEKERDETDPVSKQTMSRALKLSDWIWSHQKRTWHLLSNKKAVTEHAPLARRVAATIIELEPEIKSGALATKQIAAKLNQGLPQEQHISSKSVGRICANQLGLHKAPDKNNRGWLVSNDVIKQLKSVYGISMNPNALNALNAQTPRQDGDTEKGICNLNALNAQNEPGVYFKRPPNAQTQNPRQSMDLGVTGVCGVYKNKTTKGKVETDALPDEVVI